MTRPSVIAVVAGALGAVLLVAAMRQSLFGVMLGAMLSPMPLAMAILGLGVSFLPVAVVSGAVIIMVLTGSIALASVYLVMDALPVAIMSRLRRTEGQDGRDGVISGASIGRMVCFLVLGAAAVMLLGLVLMPVGPDGIEASLREHLKEILASVTMTGDFMQGGETADETRADMLRVLAGILPAAVAMHWCLRTILSVSLAQIALTRMNLVQGLEPDYRQFSLPAWFVAPVGVLIALAWALDGDVGYAATSAAAVLSLPLALQGLAVVHCATAQTRHRIVLLVVFYTLALLMASAAMVMLVAVGLAEQFFKLRARYLTARTGGE